jgi:hypothetical protein
MDSRIDHITALVGTAIGVWAIRAGCSRGPFYALGPGQRPKPTSKPLPLWWGRTWFLTVGCVSLYWAIPRLRGQWQWSEFSGYWWVPVVLLTAWAEHRLLNLGSYLGGSRIDGRSER